MWLFGIEMVVVAENWGNEITLSSAIIALRGRARTEARMAMADDELETWSDLCDLRRNRFGPVSPVACWNRKLMTMKQKRDEGVRVFSSRFRNALTQLERVQGSKLPEMTSVSWFLEGLRQDFQAEVERVEPQSLSQAIEARRKVSVWFGELVRLLLRKNEGWFMPWAVAPGRHKIHLLTKRPHLHIGAPSSI